MLTSKSQVTALEPERMEFYFPHYRYLIYTTREYLTRSNIVSVIPSIPPTTHHINFTLKAICPPSLRSPPYPLLHLPLSPFHLHLPIPPPKPCHNCNNNNNSFAGLRKVLGSVCDFVIVLFRPGLRWGCGACWPLL